MLAGFSTEIMSGSQAKNQQLPSLGWRCLPDETSAPSPRVGASLTPLDVDGRRVLMFGGASHEEGCLSETWILDVPSSRWVRIPARGDVPPPRYEHAAVLIPPSTSTSSSLSGCILVFGGAGTDGDLFNDLHAFSPSRASWQKLTTTGDVPSPRTARGAMDLVVCAGDEGGRGRMCLMLFGGGSVGNRPVGDTGVYSLDLDSLTWTCFEPGYSPPPLLGHSLCAASHDTMLLFGGLGADGSMSNELWSFSLPTMTWSQWLSTGDAHPPVSGHSAVICESKMFVYGGLSSTSSLKAESTVASLEKLFVLDIEEKTWVAPKLAGGADDGPGPRLDHGMAVLARSLGAGTSVLVVCAGMSLESVHGDTYVLEVLS